MLHLNDLNKRIADISGISVNEAEIFTREVLRVINEGLAGGSVEIHSLGIFKLDENSQRVFFIPSKKLADVTNSAFSVFEKELLATDFPEEQIDDKNITIINHPLTETTETQIETSDINSPKHPLPAENLSEQSSVENELCQNTERHQKNPDNEIQNRNNTSGWLFWIGLILGIVIGFVIGYFLRPSISSVNTGTDNELIQSSDSIMDNSLTEPDVDNYNKMTGNSETSENSQNVTPESSPKDVTDTIKNGVFLTTLSRRHYGGRHEFWIYIYEENKDKIKNPQNVPIGTVLVIPPREKYGIDPDSPASIERAKVEIGIFESLPE